MKLPRTDSSKWKKIPTQVIDDSLARRQAKNQNQNQAKIEKMEQDYLQRQIESTPGLHLNDISAISPAMNTSSLPTQVYLVSSENQPQNQGNHYNVP